MFIKNSECFNGYGRAPYVCCTPDIDYTTTTATDRNNPTPSQQPTQPTNVISPSNGKGNVLPVPPDCGPLSLGDKIYNGNDTALDEYPWMVLLGYTEKNGQVAFDCGGSLINQRYVLTAAHCVKGAIETEIGPLKTIRLGEYDLSKEIDCIVDDCNKKVIELGYEEVIPHPEFNTRSLNRYHDIALIRLNADVSYSDFVRPVCLPLAATRRAINVGEELIVAGWGRTLLSRKSNVKQHLAVPVNDHGTCARKFTDRGITLLESQLCAGGDYARDSCDGDSGGPLMRQGQMDRWFLEGVVSFGNRCGLQGWPGVYTRVADYIDWIRSSLKP